MSGISQEPPKRRVRVYIDGFKLYHAICTFHDDRLKWINFFKLSESFLRQGERLDQVNFFTAVLNWNHEKQKRHRNFLEACKAVGVNVHEATFKQSTRFCADMDRHCRFYEEKQTDVGIAVRLVADALQRRFERAILITADSDQIPTARFVANLDHCSLSLRYPPGRQTHARDLGNIVRDRKEISVGHLRTCQLPRDVRDRSGRVRATMPALYRRPSDPPNETGNL